MLRNLREAEKVTPPKGLSTMPLPSSSSQPAESPPPLPPKKLANDTPDPLIFLAPPSQNRSRAFSSDDKRYVAQRSEPNQSLLEELRKPQKPRRHQSYSCALTKNNPKEGAVGGMCGAEAGNKTVTFSGSTGTFGATNLSEQRNKTEADEARRLIAKGFLTLCAVHCILILWYSQVRLVFEFFKIVLKSCKSNNSFFPLCKSLS